MCPVCISGTFWEQPPGAFFRADCSPRRRPGAILCAALLGATSSLFFSWKIRWRLPPVPLSLLPWRWARFSPPAVDRYFSIPIDRVMATKHPGLYRTSRGIEFSGWSPISRIDVLRMAPPER